MMKITEGSSFFKKIEFQYYPAHIYEMQPSGTITLYDFLMLQTKESQRGIFEQIAIAESSGDKKLKATLKQNNLRVFTPCVIVGEGKDGKPWKDYAHIERFTGLAVLDFDHLPDLLTAESFKQFIFREYDFIIATWLSPSMHGIKALVSIPVVSTVDEFKRYFWGLENEFKQFGDATVKQWFDSSGQNPTLSLFQSYDPKLLVTEKYTTWTTIGRKKTTYKYDTLPTPAPAIQMTSKDRETIIKIINSGFRNIVNTGHPPLRSLCISIGGYVATGYLTQTEAEQLVDWYISNHPYLCKGVKGYRKTARWGIIEGSNKPLVL